MFGVSCTGLMDAVYLNTIKEGNGCCNFQENSLTNKMVILPALFVSKTNISLNIC